MCICICAYAYVNFRSLSTGTMWSKLVSRMQRRRKDGRVFERLDSKEPSDEEKLSLRLQTPLSVAKLDVKGATRTRHYLIRRLTQSITHSSTVGEMSTRVQQALTDLKSLGVFESATASVGVVDTATQRTEGKPIAANITVEVSEKSPFSAKISTNVSQKRKMVVETMAKWMNQFGCAEKIQIQSDVDHEKNRSFSFGGEMPLHALDGRLAPGELSDCAVTSGIRASLFRRLFTESRAGLVDRQTGGEFGISWISRDHQLENHFDFEAVRREIQPSERRLGGMKVREDCEDVFRTLLRHRLVIDHRDSASFPQKGWAVRATSELAGLIGGGQQYFREECSMQWWVPFIRCCGLDPPTQSTFSGESEMEKSTEPCLVGHAWLRSGIAIPLGPQARVGIADRFFAEGSVMRGLSTNTMESQIGPRDGDFALGSDASLWGGVALMASLPSSLLRRLGVKASLWMNGGLLGETNTFSRSRSDPERSLGVLWNQFGKMTAGMGLALPLPWGGLELNYCTPLHGFRDGVNSPDFQEWHLGLGFNLL
uniref:SAM50 n=1 Tax=Stygiella incarcerata TaxID=1712417 RepID=A0A192ZIM4_9EUKA|nr:SAM50 [Stygiella incarcerata]